MPARTARVKRRLRGTAHLLAQGAGDEAPAGALAGSGDPRQVEIEKVGLLTNPVVSSRRFRSFQPDQISAFQELWRCDPLLKKVSFPAEVSP